MTGLRWCACPVPEPHGSPEKPPFCVRCSFPLNPVWTSNDTNMSEFFDRLRDSFPGKAPDWFDGFRSQCMARERAGRTTFRMGYLGRDNTDEGCEEAADGALYAYLDLLKARRAGLPEEWDLVLTAAWHAAQLHHTMRRLREKRAGSP